MFGCRFREISSRYQWSVMWKRTSDCWRSWLAVLVGSGRLCSLGVRQSSKFGSDSAFSVDRSLDTFEPVPSIRIWKCRQWRANNEEILRDFRKWQKANSSQRSGAPRERLKTAKRLPKWSRETNFLLCWAIRAMKTDVICCFFPLLSVMTPFLLHQRKLLAIIQQKNEIERPKKSTCNRAPPWHNCTSFILAVTHQPSLLSFPFYTLLSTEVVVSSAFLSSLT